MTTPKITLKRKGDTIRFIDQNNIEIAFLKDHHDRIIFDAFADSHKLFLGEGPSWPEWFLENGITVSAARAIDAA